VRRDHGGERGPVPTVWGALDHWHAARLRRRLDKFAEVARRPRRPPTGRGRFARGTFRVKL
jgi:hypothetical protein